MMKNIYRTLGLAVACTCLLVSAGASVAQNAAPAPKPKRINRAIELLAEGQPIYYTGSHSGTVGTFEQGKQDAQTWADYISYDMEAAPYDIAGLKAYMQGLAAGGPTRTGHRTPAVIVNMPVRGTDEATVRVWRRWTLRSGNAGGHRVDRDPACPVRLAFLAGRLVCRHARRHLLGTRDRRDPVGGPSIPLLLAPQETSQPSAVG